MQPNEIILAVDTLNNDTTNNETFTRFEEAQNRSVYVGATHSVGSRDTLTLYRTFPKPNGNFKGVAKTSVKFSQDHQFDGIDGVASITAPIIVEVSFSIPVGATSAQALEARQKALALLDLDTVMSPLNDQLMI